MESPCKRQKRSARRHPDEQGIGKGKQRAVHRNEDVHPENLTGDPKSAARVQGTLYDAVAGRLHSEGFILDGHRKPAAPDEFLFKRKNAPIRYQEDDKYFAHRHLPPGVSLPDSDLLKAIHAYASDFYGSGTPGDCNVDFQSMDETALLAIGILMEETCAHALGKTGDLAFVEGEDS